MKTLLFLISIIFVGCEYEKPKIENDFSYQVIEIDSCEYIKFRTYMHYAITHKGNCKFCLQRKCK